MKKKEKVRPILTESPRLTTYSTWFEDNFLGDKKTGLSSSPKSGSLVLEKERANSEVFRGSKEASNEGRTLDLNFQKASMEENSFKKGRELTLKKDMKLLGSFRLNFQKYWGR